MTEKKHRTFALSTRQNLEPQKRSAGHHPPPLRRACYRYCHDASLPPSSLTPPTLPLPHPWTRRSGQAMRVHVLVTRGRRRRRRGTAGRGAAQEMTAVVKLRSAEVQGQRARRCLRRLARRLGPGRDVAADVREGGCTASTAGTARAPPPS